MTVDAAAVTRELTDYLRQRPEELGPLIPLYDALRDHARRGRCPHGGRCPEVRAGALLSDERGRLLLLLRHSGGWAFPEGAPVPGDEGLRGTAYGLLREFGGVRAAWAVPGAEGPVLVDVDEDSGGGAPRLRVGFRYLFAARAQAVPRAVLRTGPARWAGPGRRRWTGGSRSGCGRIRGRSGRRVRNGREATAEGPSRARGDSGEPVTGSGRPRPARGGFP